MKVLFGHAMRELAFTAMLCGCPPAPPAPPTPDADSGQPIFDAAPAPADAAPPPPATDSCGRAEAHLLELGCKDSRGRLLGGPNLHGVGWADICRGNLRNGVSMQPDCIALAKSCAEVMTCR